MTKPVRLRTPTERAADLPAETDPIAPTLRKLGQLSAPAVAARWGRAYMEPVTAPLYDREILRLAASIPHHRRLDRPQASAERRSPLCGSRVTVDVVLDEQGRVVSLGQEVKACALGQASASLMGAHAIGRSAGELNEARDALADFLKGRRDDPGSWPGLEIFDRAKPYSARHPAILLAFEAAAEAAGAARR
jgi:NifU-like protein involved in Fe-S cluster formation